MHINAGPSLPIQCSKCGSREIVKPVNEPNVILRCADCGHQKLESKKSDFEWPELRATPGNDKDKFPSF